MFDSESTPSAPPPEPQKSRSKKPFLRFFTWLKRDGYDEAEEANDKPKIHALALEVWKPYLEGIPTEPALLGDYIVQHGNVRHILKLARLGGRALNFEVEHDHLPVSHILIKATENFRLGEIRYHMPEALEKILASTLVGISFDRHALGLISQNRRNLVQNALTAYKMESADSLFDHEAAIKTVLASLQTTKVYGPEEIDHARAFSQTRRSPHP